MAGTILPGGTTVIARNRSGLGWLLPWRNRARAAPVVVVGGWPRFGSLAVLLLTLNLATPCAGSAPVLLYATGFEPPVFAAGYTLTDQDGWQSFPKGTTAASQIVAEIMPGYGQHALIGFALPESNSNFYASAFRPLNYDPVGQGNPLVAFRVLLSFIDSVDRPERDSFRWSVYNRQAERLCSVDFNNQSRLISYALDDGTFHSTDREFNRDSLYTLEMVMDFSSNAWTAVLNGEVIVNSAPLTTGSRALDLGDIDPVWIQPEGSSQFGDNYMLFDDLRITAAPSAPLPSEVQLVQFLEDESLLLRVVGEPNRAYALEASSGLADWTALTTNVPTDGTFLFADPEAAIAPRRFYRARAIWP